MYQIDERSSKNIESKLKLNHIVFDRLSFQRVGFHPDPDSNSQPGIRFGYAVNKDGDGEYRVSLTADVNREKEYEAFVEMTGYFSVDENDPQKDILINKNSFAILFPYLRTQISLLTTQPETVPLILPPINIVGLIQDSE